MAANRAVFREAPTDEGAEPDLWLLGREGTRLVLSVSGSEVQRREAERAFMVGERVVHDGVR